MSGAISRVAFVGLGNMGGPMALNLHKEYKKNPELIGKYVAYMMACGNPSAVTAAK